MREKSPAKIINHIVPSVNCMYHLHHQTQHLLFATQGIGVTSLHSSY